MPLTGGQQIEGAELCEIRWWRGYIKAEFYAVELGEGVSASEVERSPQFVWLQNEPPPDGHRRAKAAHDRLVARLGARGWEPLGQAVPWYAQRFRRSVAGLRVLPADGGGAPDSGEGTVGS
jgi:hypothetical protein